MCAMSTNARQAGPLNQALADEIRGERNAKRLTQTEMIERSRIPRSTYVKIEAGKRSIDVTELGKIASALELPMSTLTERAERRLRNAGIEVGAEAEFQTEQAAKDRSTRP